MRRSGIFVLLTGALADRFVFLDNGVIRAGIDATRGGSIGYLAQSGTNYSVINAHDMGREIQLSFYGGPNPYNPNNKCNTAWGAWPWNPIGAGDIAGNSGQVLSLQNSSTQALVTTIPLQWACDDVPCECEFVQNVTLAPGATWLTVLSTISNHRSDLKDYGAFGQELPATYSIGDLHVLKSYTGTAPWTNAPIDLIATPQPQPPWVPGIFTGTEQWAALLDENDWGFGVVSPKFSQFNAGFHGTPGGGPNDDPTGYIAPYSTLDLTANISYTFAFSIVLGNLATIRSYAYQIHAAAIAEGASPLAVDFLSAAARAEWIALRGAKAASAKGMQLMGADVMCVGPATPWEAASVPRFMLQLSVCGMSGLAAVGNATLQLHFLPAGSRVYAEGAVGSALLTQVAGGALPIVDRSPVAMGLGEQMSSAWSASMSIPVDCHARNVTVSLEGVAGFTGTILQMGIALVSDAGAQGRENGTPGIVVDLTSLTPVKV